MTSVRRVLSRVPIDPYLILLVGTVLIASVFPARGAGKIVIDASVTIAVMLLFFLYGARLAPSAIWAGLTHWRLQSLVFASTYLLFPLIGLGAVMLVGGALAHDIATGVLFLAVLPSTVQSSIAFTSIARGNVPAALCSASVSNLAGVVLTPLLAALLLPGVSQGFSTGAVQSIIIQILLPFAAGQIAHPFLAGWIGRHKRLTQTLDRGAILLVVYAAFSEGVVAGVWARLTSADLGLLFVLDAAILAVVMAATTFASRQLRFSKEDEIAIVFCGSKKSMASGIPMATILFPGQAVSLIVLPLMLFHQIQLFVCAALARRYARRPMPGAVTAAVNAA